MSPKLEKDSFQGLLDGNCDDPDSIDHSKLWLE